MFSEYASRFLAQSQSRLSNFGQADNDKPTARQPTEWQSRAPRPGGRSYLGRGFGAANPYQPAGSRFGQILGASRYASQDAPLFQAALEQEEDEEEERGREAADLYALQRSRRVIAASRMSESAESDHEAASRGSLDQSQERESASFSGRPRGMGIKSSWNGTRSFRHPARDQEPTLEEDARESSRRHDSQPSEGSSSNGSRGKMVDIGLESQIEDDDDPPADLTMETPVDSVPAFQKFNSTAGPSRFALRREGTQETDFGHGPPPSSVGTDVNLTPIAAIAPDTEIFKHDPFFAWIYLIAIASMLATFVLVYLHTSTPSGKLPLGDTIYTILHSSFHLLAVDTIVAVVVSLVWLAALRSFVRPLVTLIFIAVPVILFSFFLYPFISSYQDETGGKTFQDVVMRWAAIIPGFGAILWLYLAYKGRHSIRSAIEILDFSSRILAANSALVLVGMGSLAAVVLWTWAWLAMFTRVFLGGYFAGSRFIISASTWWLGIYFVLMYIWTISVISGVQRGTTAATVSQWYFHRNVVPAPSSTEVVSAAFNHSVTTIFGSISLSTLLALAIRLPLLILPSRLAGLISMFAYSFVPTPIAALTNPLTLTYAAIHSNTLAMSARGLSTMDFLSPNAPTTTLTPQTFSNRRSAHSPLLPYRLAKLILHATRFIMATGLGFAGWVITARQLQIKLPDGIGMRGSAYAYVVGLVASFIGWGILGAMEGILSGIVDAVVICYGSEKRMPTGGGGYCMEAAALFGDRRDEFGRDEIY
ncbi:hypothetical protein CONLIGDRAFT_432205 [Coniochaeta ligniaria NRRL 30616]|uniref:Protein PNS1 n=1 Tax=Coniochaeta ligniaria NRRL 30616 TaxID=1408157 RepID=A0A1J7J2E4_9PEZI|nr:hypothetical protein CONLIGDRAFT_432205 [Coniochaeta ligniaria NRRL 30616]